MDSSYSVCASFNYSGNIICGDSDSIRVYSADFTKVGNIPFSNTDDIIAADMDNDGKEEIVVSDGNIYLLDERVDTLYDGGDVESIDILDRDSDGILDILFSTPHGIFLLRKGETGYVEEQISSKGAYILTSGRINENRIPDIVAGGDGGVFVIYDFSSEEDIMTSLPVAISLLDFDSDYDIDMIVFTAKGASLYENTEGNFSYNMRIDMKVKFSYIMDMDVDGDEDLLVYHGDTISIMKNTNGSFIFEYVDTIDGVSGLYAFDSNSDGSPDIVALRDGYNIFYRNLSSFGGCGMRFKGRGAGLSSETPVPLLVKSNGRSFLINRGSGSSGTGDYSYTIPANSFVEIEWQSGVIDTLTVRDSIIVYEDMYPPFAPDTLVCITHEENQWSNKNLVKFYWENSVDNYMGSGIKGYSYIFSESWDEVPDNIIEIEYPDSTLTVPLEDGRYYFSLIAVDSAGNVSDVKRFGPILVDTTPPSIPQVFSPEEEASLPKGPVYFEWERAEDVTSGVRDYTLLIYRDSLLLVREDSVTIDSNHIYLFLDAGRKFFKIRTRDNAGNFSETELRAFDVDTIPPTVRYTHPDSASTDQHINTNIIVLFSEEMDSTTINSSSFYIMSINYGKIKGSVRKEGNLYIFEPEAPLYPLDKYIVTLKGDIKDVAGNTLDGNENGIAEGSPEDDYIWWFETGEREDTIPPVVKNISVSPNPTDGDSVVEVRAIASDIERGDSPIKVVELFVDVRGWDGSGIYMEPMDEGFDSPEEMAVSHIHVGDLPSGTHTIYVHAQDASKNWGDYDSTVLIVTEKNTVLPQFSFSFDKLNFTIGERLKGKIFSTKKLVYFKLYLSDSISFNIPLSTKDSMEFNVDWKIEEIYPDSFNLIFEGKDADNNVNMDSLKIYIGSPQVVIVKENTYIVPNPVKEEGNATVYFYVTTPCTVKLSIFTLEGRKIYEKEKKVDVGGRFESMSFDTERLKSGLYLIKLTGDSGKQQTTVLKRMGVIR